VNGGASYGGTVYWKKPSRGRDTPHNKSGQKKNSKKKKGVGAGRKTQGLVSCCVSGAPVHGFNYGGGKSSA